MTIFKGNKEYFPGIGQIQYEGPDSKSPMDSNGTMLIR